MRQTDRQTNMYPYKQVDKPKHVYIYIQAEHTYRQIHRPQGNITTAEEGWICGCLRVTFGRGRGGKAVHHDRPPVSRVDQTAAWVFV